MKINNLSLRNYRVFSNISLNPHLQKNIFVGLNAQGKTSLLEAIHVLGFTKSHKNTKDEHIIQNDTEYTKIDGLIDFNGKKVSLEVIVSKDGKKAIYNGIEMKRLSEYIGSLNVVFFAPEDLDLVKGNPKVRRRFLDLELGQTSKRYLHLIRQYQKILKERNHLLKKMQTQKQKDYMLLDVITDQLIGYQQQLVEHRKAFLIKISTLAEKHYQFLSNSQDKLEIIYLPSIDKNYEKVYQSKYEFDCLSGSTNLGVHRDNIEFLLNGKQAKDYASQGEQRSIVLSIKLAMVEYVYHQTKGYPIFLLDDVLSELDQERQNQLFLRIDKNVQTFITTTNINEIEKRILKNASIYQIHDGNIKEMNQDGKHI
jgi:DNA replication and repair protein RecF